MQIIYIISISDITNIKGIKDIIEMNAQCPPWPFPIYSVQYPYKPKQGPESSEAIMDSSTMTLSSGGRAHTNRAVCQVILQYSLNNKKKQVAYGGKTSDFGLHHDGTNNGSQCWKNKVLFYYFV
jgi:hypothetical protein